MASREVSVFADAKRGYRRVQEVNVGDAVSPTAWCRWTGTAPTVAPASRPTTSRRLPPTGATFAVPPAARSKPRTTRPGNKDFVQWMAQSQSIELYSARPRRLASASGESERDFRIRVQPAAREAARRAGREAARQVRDEDDAHRRMHPQGRTGGGTSRASRRAARRWARGLGRCDDLRRAARSQGGQREHAGPRHHRRARGQPFDEGKRGRGHRGGAVSHCRKQELAALQQQMEDEAPPKVSGTTDPKSKRWRSSPSGAAWTSASLRSRGFRTNGHPTPGVGRRNRRPTPGVGWQIRRSTLRPSPWG